MLTIGSVCALLRAEFPELSLSKIRYFEARGLIAPRRTPSGYRIFSEADIERLRTILRAQRDEYLPLKVIREELALPSGGERRRRSLSLVESEREIDLVELCQRAGTTTDFIHELGEYGLLAPRISEGENYYTEIDADIARVCARIAGYGIDARHLRAFRHAADRVSGLLEQLIAPSLRSRKAERRRAVVGDLEILAGQAHELTQLLVLRDLRALISR